MANRTDRIGERFISNEGCEFVIVEYKNRHDLWVQFQDEHGAKVRTTYQNCQKGEVKNSYHPCVYDRGMIGLMSDGSKPKTTDGNGKHTREYSLWRGMIQRCYDEKCHERQPTYKGCQVSDRWLVFSNFLEDLPLIEGYEMWLNNPNSRVSLDKDSKIKGNKVYSLETCKFISNSENAKERIERCGKLNPPKKVMAISLTENKVIVFKSMSQAEQLGFDQSHISKCCQGKYKTHKGYKWRLV